MFRKTLVLMLALAPAVAWGAIVTPVDTPHAGEESLWQIVNTLYGTTFTNQADMEATGAQIGAEIFAGGVTVSASATAVYAANTQTFGWYETAVGPVTTNTLFNVTGTGYAVTGAASFTAWNDFGLFLTTTGGSTTRTWYSEVPRNSDGIDHQALYDLAVLTGNAAYAGSYLSAWEDLKYPSSNYDGDYNDLVLQIDTNVIPEPTTMTLLGLGLAGLAARRMRNRKA